MRRTLPTIVLSVAALAAFAAPAAASTAPPEEPGETTVPADPSATEAAATPEDTAATAEIGATAGSAVVVVDESGSELAALTVTDTEPAWTGFGEGEEPESGYEYLRVTVVVESRSPRGLFSVDYDDFILQDRDGFVTGAEIVPTAEQSAAEEDPISEAELANTETVELVVTFEMVSGVPPTAMYFSPSSERLVTIYQF
jgi:hypothetical protein